MEDNFDKTINEFLELLDRKLKKYEKYPEGIDIQQLVHDRVEQSKKEIIGKDYLLDRIKNREKEIEQLKQIKGLNVIKDEMWPEVISMMVMHADKCEENERQVMRANYNLHSNNEIFRILDLIYNNNSSTYNLSVINENVHILKINLAMFLINYSFEKMIGDVRSIIQSDLGLASSNNDELTNQFKNLNISIKERIIDKIISKYKDVQLVGDILGELKIFDENGELTSLLKTKSSTFKRSYTSQLKAIRNAASHGEYYPNLEKESDIRLIVDNNGIKRFEYEYIDIIGIANKYIDMLSDKNEIVMFLKLFRTNNLENTVYLCLQDENSKNKLIETICILSLFNVIQYNNEKHFRDKNENSLLKKMNINFNESQNYLDKFDIGYYFKSSFNTASSDEVLQTIKYAIGHMKFKYNGQEFIFTNPENHSQKCSCNIGKLLLFISEDEVYNLTISTSYYEKVLKTRKVLMDNYIYGNKILKDKDINNIFGYNIINQKNNLKK